MRMDETLPIKEDEVEAYLDALTESPLGKTMEVLRLAAKQQGALCCLIRTVSKDPWRFEFDLAAQLLDPLSGTYKTVKLGALQPLEEVQPTHDSKTDDVQSFAVSAPASLN